MSWRKRARLLLGVFIVVFAVVVAFAFKKRTPPPPAPPVVPTAPGTVVQSTGGRVERFTFARESVSIQYDKQQTFSDNTTKMFGVRVVTTERGGNRTFSITGREGLVGQNESTIVLDGDVRIAASDGLTLKTEHATYADAEGIVKAPGPVEFARGRMRGTGVGLTYDKARDILAIPDQAVVHLAADASGNEAADITAGGATMARREKTITFERTMHVQRPSQTIDADGGTAYLSGDEKRIEAIDLQGHARIGGSGTASGGLQALSGDGMNLKYRPDGQSLEHALVTGAATMQLAGDQGKPGRDIAAATLDITLAPDGSTPTSLVARQGVRLNMPADAATPGRTISADAMDAKGEAGKGLTRARFTGSVDYREAGNGMSRAAKAAALEVSLKPGSGDIEEARFSGRVRFEEGNLAATGNTARYDLAKGTLELRGTDRDLPHMVNERIAVDGARLDVTLAGPKVKAVSTVKSVLQPAKPGEKADSKVPSMLKADQPVNVTADNLDYDGAASRAVYTGAAVLWQGDTTVKGASITIDDKTGDLAATGPVTTTAMLEQTDKDNKKERVRSIATASDFKYTEAKRLAVYTGGAHLSGPQGDIEAARIDLYLKPSGDEVDRAEAFADDKEAMTIREQNRKTTGAHMTYTSADDRYVVTGKPATNTDACGNETSGSTLTFAKATDTIIVDGNGFRTQTKGTGACK